MEDLGLQKTPNPERELSTTVEGIKYTRYPVKTPFVKIGDNLDSIIEKYGKVNYKEGDVFCVASKIISIATEGLHIHESELKVSWLAKFLVKFVKKWPEDPGYAVPEKIQLAINIVGMPRFLFAMIVGGILKYLGRPGYFYRLAGNQISSIDGFISSAYEKDLHGYGFILPKDCDKWTQDVEDKFNMNTALLDGNNVENIVLGMSNGLKKRFSKEQLLEILKGNPQGQKDGTPILIVRPER